MNADQFPAFGELYEQHPLGIPPRIAYYVWFELNVLADECTMASEGDDAVIGLLDKMLPQWLDATETRCSPIGSLPPRNVSAIVLPLHRSQRMLWRSARQTSRDHYGS